MSMKIHAYVQGRNGEEWNCIVSGPASSKFEVDKCVFIPRDALEIMLANEDDNHFWLRVVSEEYVGEKSIHRGWRVRGY